MSMVTNWGYELTNQSVLPNMMSAEEYITMTGRNDDGSRVEMESAAACAAIRNYVGWHLFPAAGCKLKTTIDDRRVTFVGNDALIQLPARHVTNVSSVIIGGVTYTGFFCETNGLLRVYDVEQRYNHAAVEVQYTAGLNENMMAPIKELIAHRITHAIAVPPGITSEASGGVSVTYNAGWPGRKR